MVVIPLGRMEDNNGVKIHVRNADVVPTARIATAVNVVAYRDQIALQLPVALSVRINVVTVFVLIRLIAHIVPRACAPKISV